MALVNWSFITSSDWDIDHPECFDSLLDLDFKTISSLQKNYIA